MPCYGYSFKLFFPLALLFAEPLYARFPEIPPLPHLPGSLLPVVLVFLLGVSLFGRGPATGGVRPITLLYAVLDCTK